MSDAPEQTIIPGAEPDPSTGADATASPEGATASPADPSTATQPPGERTFSEARVDEIIANATAPLVDKIAALEAKIAPPDDATPAEPETPPVGVSNEALKLQAERDQLAAEAKQARADLAALRTTAEQAEVRGRFESLLDSRPDVINDPRARRDILDALVRSDGYAFRDGQIVPTDPKAQPADLVAGWLRDRTYYLKPAPEGSGAAPTAAPNQPSRPGSNGQTQQGFDPSKYFDAGDAIAAAAEYDRQTRKG